MFSQLTKLVAVMAAFFFLQVGHAGLGALITQQGPKYDFSDAFLGILTSVSYAGFFVGNYAVRYLLPRVSYIRTFSVCAALITIWVLLLPILPGKSSWIILRFLHGVFFSSCIVISEGWINSTVSNQNRGRVYGVYMIVGYAAFGVSQYILIVSESVGTAAFSLIAMFMILSLVPLCMTRVPEPQTSVQTEGQKVEKLSLIGAYRISPVPFIGQLTVGMTQGSAWLFVRYAESVAKTTAEVSFLAMLFFVSGMALQIPVGWWADKAKDRRSVMTSVYVLSAAFAFLLYFGGYFPASMLAVLIFAYGAISVTSFSLNISYGQIFVDEALATEYVGRIYQVFALGAIVGPVVAGYLMDALSLEWLFAFCGFVFAGAAIITFTSIAIPKGKRREVETYQALSPHLPPTTVDTPMYNELEIGPAAPTDIQHSELEIGPVAPTDRQHSELEIGPVAPTDRQPSGSDADISPALPDDWQEQEGEDTHFVGPQEKQADSGQVIK